MGVDLLRVLGWLACVVASIWLVRTVLTIYVTQDGRL